MDDIYFLPFTIDVAWLLLVLAVLLVCSALVSGSETAFFALSPQDVEELEDETSKGAKMTVKLLDTQDSLLAAIIISNNLINIGAIIIANSVIDSLVDFGGRSLIEFLIKVVVVTFILLLFGEIMPKVFAAYNAKKLAKRMAAPLSTINYILRPLSNILIKSGYFVNKNLTHKHTQNFSIDEISDAIDMTENQSAEDRKMLSGIVRFVNTEVVAIMKPRVDVVALDVDVDFKVVKQLVIDTGFSRIPVFDNDFDNIKGILYVKDLLPFLAETDDFGWQKLIRKPYFVPEYKKINDLLEEFQAKQIHLAVVVDEYGGTQGIVTLEDILEEIVGEISDESDHVESFYTKIDPYTYIFEGKTHLNDLLRVLSMPDDTLDDVRGDADTLAGLMLEINGDFLKVGDEILYKSLHMIVKSIDGRRIQSIKVTVKP